MDLSENYQKEYQKLNLEQQQAVEAIEGPVIVVAGAGTGKTQTISLRIANILLKTHTSPNSILALTFTESGVLSMRKRLLSILGPSAYQVKIHTFHSYCNDLVTSSPEAFSLSPNSQPLDDLQRGQIIKQCIDSLPALAALKPWGDTYFYQTEILSQIQTLKREGFSPSEFEKLLADDQLSLSNLYPFYDYLKSIRATDKIRLEIITRWQAFPSSNNPFYQTLNSQFVLEKNGYFIKTADFKASLLSVFDDFGNQVPKLQNLSAVYQLYQQKLHDLSFYDYEDMILLVLQKFTTDPYFLSKQQELNQYILVDEYQDTNTAQNQLLYALGSYDPAPNLFVVGDDDQSIFRFQGANLENIYSFYQHYKQNIQVITLNHNYRSQSHVLTHANQLINQNQNRLVSWLPNLNKTPTAKSTHPARSIILSENTTQANELNTLAKTILDLLKHGHKPDEIAILLKTNQQANIVANYLTSQNIPNFQENGLDIFNQAYILRFLHILQTCCNPNLENLGKLYAIKLSPKELFLHTHFQKSTSHLRRLNRLITRSQKDIARLNPHQAFLNILRRFKFLPQKYINLFALKSLSDHFLSQATQDLDFKQILTVLLQQKSQKLPLSFFIPEEFKQGKVRLLTVHKAKGLEFEHVFIPFLNDKIWGNTSSHAKLKLPPGILSQVATILNQPNPNEEERRLFYVALTRAKIQLYLSYSKFSDSNKEILPSMFLSELNQDLLEKITSQSTCSSEPLLAYFKQSKKQNQKVEEFSSYLKNYLVKNYVLTASDLNSYLTCPHCFYYQKILALPLAKNKHLLYGTAMHTALTQYYRQKLSLPNLIEIFRQSLLSYHFPSNLDYEESLKKGEQVLNLYYPILQLEKYNKILLEHNFRREHLTYENIPITGKIDKLKYIENGLILSDFKTGKPGNYARYSDYERQLLFYYLLCQQSNIFQPKPSHLAIEYLTPNTKGQFETKLFEISKEKLDQLKTEIQEVYKKILSLDFSHIGKICQDPNNLHSIK